MTNRWKRLEMHWKILPKESPAVAGLFALIVGSSGVTNGRVIINGIPFGMFDCTTADCQYVGHFVRFTINDFVICCKVFAVDFIEVSTGVTSKFFQRLIQSAERLAFGAPRWRYSPQAQLQ